MNLDDLQARQVELHEQSQSILARAEAEKRDPDDSERQELDTLLAQMKTTKADIERMTELNGIGASLKESSGRKTQPDVPVATMRGDEDDEEQPAPRRPQSRDRITMIDNRDRTGGKWGWRSFGEFSQGVRAAAMHGGTMDPRLSARMATPSTYGSEGIGTDGGFAVPPDFRAAIMQKVLGEDSLMSRTDIQTTSSNVLTIPKDETTPWQTTGGVQAEWQGEGGLKTQSKVSLQNETIKLNKLVSLVPVTDELLEDAPALDGYLRRKVPEKMIFKMNLAIVQGDGVGKPLGILNAASLVTVSKESSQAADTILPANIFKMYSRLYAPLLGSSVWLVNQDVLPQLYSMTLPVKNVAGTENVGGSAVYTPANGLAGSPYGTLMGRPIVLTQACETIGDVGDIIFVDLKSYMTAQKTQGIQSDTSIHLWFDYDMTAFRFVFRMAGKPWWSDAITVRDGSNNLSWAVALEAR